MPTTDIIQRVRNAAVAALDARAGIVALTGRANGNVVPWRSRAKGEPPIIAYLVVSGAQTGGVGDTRRIVVQFSCFGPEDDEETANALAEQVELGFNTLALQTLPTPLDAVVLDRSRRSVDDDASARADIDITLWVTK